MEFKIGDYIIQNIDGDNNCYTNTIKNIKFLKIFEVIELTTKPIIVIGRHLDLTSHLVGTRFRLASEKEVKEYKLKKIFLKETKK